MAFLTTSSRWTSALVEISPKIMHNEFLTADSQATFASGSSLRQASSTESEIMSQSLSGWPDVTLSEENRKWPLGKTIAHSMGRFIQNMTYLVMWHYYFTRFLDSCKQKCIRARSKIFIIKKQHIVKDLLNYGSLAKIKCDRFVTFCIDFKELLFKTMYFISLIFMNSFKNFKKVINFVIFVQQFRKHISIMQSVQPTTQKQTKIINGIPSQYFQNPLLNSALKALPQNYDFQVQKTLYRIDQLKKQLNRDSLRVSLQFPQGLMLFGCLLSDIITAFSKCEVVMLGDVTYGACCVDDLASTELECDLLIHYGHSCLVPITETKKKVLYVFVEMKMDIQHFVQTFMFNFPEKDQEYFLLSTIQFNTSIFQAQDEFNKNGYNKIVIPQEKPRSAGQVLGCTSPTLPNPAIPVIFVCDGRFHMQSTMIANPNHNFYQYNPYNRELTVEKYENKQMMRRREEELARALSGNMKKFAFIFGTLGRQGNVGILNRMKSKVNQKYEYFTLLVSQVNDVLLKLLQDEVDFFVQVSCPRLSIDWGYKSAKPLLTPYEFFVLMGAVQWKQTYPMDYYSNNGGQWTNYFGRQTKKPARVKLALQKS